jgi:alkanesulfonate monooxygenase SsuD/methylene tetrahydromethanopterin reductase-like flavin-dependent oxidoreductase (luciferase family)
VIKTYSFELLTYPYDPDPSTFDRRKCAELYESHFDSWVECESLGYDGIFFSEHHFTAYNLSPSPNLLVAALARRTTRMRLGVMCNVLPFHNPLRLAEETAMLDYLTNGRLEVGLGRGADALEFEKMGVPHEETRAIFEESLELMKNAWTNPVFSHKGKYFSYENATLWPQPIKVPQPWITCISPETVAFGGRSGFKASFAFLPVPILADYVNSYWSAVEDAGRDPAGMETAVLRNVVIAPTDAEANEIAAPALTHLFDLFKKVAVFRDLDHVPQGYEFYSSFFRPFSGPVSYEDLRDSGIAVVGSPETVRDRIVDQVEQIGTENILLFASFGNLNADQIRRTHRLYAEHVMPVLRDMKVR